MMKKIILLHFFYLMFAVVTASAHSPAKTKVIQSDILGQDRKIIIHLPNSYAQTKDTSYPVLYMLDGGSYDKLTDTVIKKNVKEGKMPETIIVAITNNDKENIAIDRTYDLSPTYTRMEEGRRFGNADRFYAFIKQEVVTLIEESYRTTDKRIIMGHSFGGLFVMHNMIRDPDFFDTYYIYSPALSRAEPIIYDDFTEFLKSKQDINAYIFLAVGELESDNFIHAYERVVAILDKYAPQGLHYQSSYVIGADHMATPRVSIPLDIHRMYLRKL